MKNNVIKHLILLKIQYMTDLNVELLEWFIKFYIKISSGGPVKSETISSQQLPEELPKSFTRKFQKRKTCSLFKDNVCCANLADIHLVSKYKKIF